MPVVVVSGNEDHSVIRRSIEYGALGFIPKAWRLKRWLRPFRQRWKVKRGFLKM